MTKMVDGAYVTTAAVETYYAIGTNAETALAGSWGYLGDSIPYPAKKVSLTPDTQPCYVRIISLDLYQYCVVKGLNPASAAQIPLAVDQKYDFEDVWLVYYQRNALGDGKLSIVAQR